MWLCEGARPTLKMNPTKGSSQNGRRKKWRN